MLACDLARQPSRIPSPAPGEQRSGTHINNYFNFLVGVLIWMVLETFVRAPRRQGRDRGSRPSRSLTSPEARPREPRSLFFSPLRAIRSIFSTCNALRKEVF